MADFPNAIFTPRAVENLPGIVYDAAETQTGFAEDYSKPAAEIAAIETTLGTNPQGAYATVKAWLTALAAVCADFVSSASINPGHLHSKLVASDGSPNPAVSVDAAGNVNIGTTGSTQGRLVVSGGNTNSIAVIAASFTGGANAVNVGDDGTDAVIGPGNSSTKLHFLSRVAGVYSRAMTIISTGNVGIGTTGPEAKLHVYNATGNVFSYVESAGANSNVASFYKNDANAWQVGINGGASDNFSIGLNGFASTMLSISTDGKIGIGTTEPTSKLDVNDDHIRVRTAKTPASADAAGNAGDIAWDANYIYICTATNTWKRTAIGTW